MVITFTPVSSATSELDVVQVMTTSWTDKGKKYYRYSVKIVNRSSKTVKNLKVAIAEIHGPLWGLTKNGEDYGFPWWVDSIAAGKSLEFVYIHAAAQATVSISGYTLE